MCFTIYIIYLQNYSTPGTIICQMTGAAISNNGSSSSNGSSTSNEASSDAGNANSYAKKSIPYYISGCELNVHPRVGDKVTFDVYQVNVHCLLIYFNI